MSLMFLGRKANGKQQVQSTSEEAGVYNEPTI